MEAQNSSLEKDKVSALFSRAKSFVAKHFYVTTIVILLSAFSGATYTISLAVEAQWENSINRLDSSFEQVIENRNKFSSTFTLTHQSFARTEILPQRQLFLAMADDVRSTSLALADMQAPTWRIDRNRRAYRSALQQLLGAINQYDETAYDYAVLFNAFQTEANIAGDLRDAVEVYTAGGLRSLWGTLF